MRHAVNWKSIWLHCIVVGYSAVCGCTQHNDYLTGQQRGCFTVTCFFLQRWSFSLYYSTEICSIQPEHVVYTVLYPTMQFSGLCCMHTESYERLQKKIAEILREVGYVSMQQFRCTNLIVQNNRTLAYVWYCLVAFIASLSVGAFSAY